MKYIRTKYGRIIDLKNWSRVETICVNSETDEVKKDICYQRSWFEQHGDTCEYKNEYISHNGQVLKEADTIEELCDEFVFIDIGIRQDKKYIFQSLKEAESKDFLYDKCYGAIWTDKGLIYVAKMNDKGELELL